MIRYLLPLAGLCGCTVAGALRDHHEQAKARFAAVRPDADLTASRAELWDDAAILRAVEIERGLGGLSVPGASQILAAQKPTLEALGLFSKADFESLAEITNPAWADGLTMPKQGLYFTRPNLVMNLRLLVHELSHVASGRLGYIDPARTSLFRGRALDPDWTDLDALVALWALEESTAEITSAVALADDAERVWSRRVVRADSKEPVIVRGPGEFIVGNSKVKLDEGSSLTVNPGKPAASARLLSFVYQPLPERVKHLRKPGEPLEDSIRRAWAGFSYTTAELLAPERPAAPSRMAMVLKDRGSNDAIGATRIGQFMVRDFLIQRAGADGALASSLKDDLVLRLKGGRLIWMLEWADDASAAAFRDAYTKANPGAKIEVRGRAILVTVGDGLDAWDIARPYVAG